MYRMQLLVGFNDHYNQAPHIAPGNNLVFRVQSDASMTASVILSTTICRAASVSSGGPYISMHAFRLNAPQPASTKIDENDISVCRVGEEPLLVEGSTPDHGVCSDSPIGR